MVGIEITKNKKSSEMKFTCDINITYTDKRFSDFVRSEKRTKSLHYHIKSSRLKAVFGKNPYTVNIVGYQGNKYRQDLKPFVSDHNTFEFNSEESRNNFAEAIQKGLNQYFDYVESLYTRQHCDIV